MTALFALIGWRDTCDSAADIGWRLVVTAGVTPVTAPPT
jgi:hypothetical protein